jgi:nucleoside recognition membrane protein YjiH
VDVKPETITAWGRTIVAAVVLGGFFSVLILFVMKDRNMDIVNTLLGFLGGAFTSIVSFHFGTTSGSAEKTRLLAMSQPISVDQRGEDGR